MEKFKGTPGNWHIDEENPFTVDTRDKNEWNNIVCIAPEGFESMKYWEANSKLISCAPEMLEMLQKAKEKLRTVDSPVTSCRRLANEIDELIKKATE